MPLARSYEASTNLKFLATTFRFILSSSLVSNPDDDDDDDDGDDGDGDGDGDDNNKTEKSKNKCSGRFSENKPPGVSLINFRGLVKHVCYLTSKSA